MTRTWTSADYQTRLDVAAIRFAMNLGRITQDEAVHNLAALPVSVESIGRIVYGPQPGRYADGRFRINFPHDRMLLPAVPPRVPALTDSSAGLSPANAPAGAFSSPEFQAC